jgi:hypothetical protein
MPVTSISKFFGVELPAGFLQQQVDEVVARLGFGIVVRVGLRAVGLLRGGHLLAQRLQLGVQRGLVASTVVSFSSRSWSCACSFCNCSRVCCAGCCASGWPWAAAR